MFTLFQQSDIWAGTEGALEMIQNVEMAVRAGNAANVVAKPQQRFDKLAGNVAVVSVTGPLLNVPQDLADMFGMTTYEGIQAALMQAAADPEVKSIALVLNTPGGAVNGIESTANVIREVGKIKPIDAFVEGDMLSAGAYLGVAARKIYASKLARVGSIGVITNHIDRSAQAAAEGVKVTVLRAGEFKALASPFEPLSDKARAQIQASLDGAYKVFVQHVADSRGVSYNVADKKMAQGQEFTGEEGIAAGLIDGISTFSDVINNLSRQAVDKPATVSNNAATFKGRTAMATSGEQLASTATTDVAATTAPVEAITAAVVQDQTTAPAATTQTLDLSAENTRLSGVLAYVEGRLKATESELIAMKGTLVAAEAGTAALKAQVASAEKIAADVTEIVKASMKQMSVALNMGMPDVSGLAPAELLAKHGELAKTFQDKFPVGGVAAATSGDETAAATVAPVPHNHARHIGATQLNRK